MPARSSSSSSTSSSDEDAKKSKARLPASGTVADKVVKLESSYKRLLEATAKLMQRTSRRHASIKDLERTVLYMRSLYNQVEKDAKSDVPPQ